jgi:hypothetical protein
MTAVTRQCQDFFELPTEILIFSQTTEHAHDDSLFPFSSTRLKISSHGRSNLNLDGMYCEKVCETAMVCVTT